MNAKYFATEIKSFEKTKYSHVFEYTFKNKSTKKYLANMPYYKYYRFFDTERDAAIAVDKVLIQNGKDPENILKRSK